MIYNNERPAILMFQDGTYFEGIGIGATAKITGEITFSTIPGSGYIEALTDSTFKDQIILFTYPSIGNYGVPDKIRDEYGILRQFESETIKVKGIILNEYCEKPSHYESIRTLEDWLIEENIPGIQWIDTRIITQKFVKEGSKLGLLQVYNAGEKPNLEELKKAVQTIETPSNKNIAANVSVKKLKKYIKPDSKGSVVIYDLGAKNNIIRTLLSKNLEVVLVPYLYDYDMIMKLNPNGVILSNGPGNPTILKQSIRLARKLIENNVPTMGIGLGHNIIGLAAGAFCYKMTAEHRGGRTTVENDTDHCYITFQNHGYCLKDINKNGFAELFHDKDDNTNEGLIHESKPIFSVAFNPEASPGALDMKEPIFEKFIKYMEVD
ncbi:MAG: carbamoyl-phosphate synthase small subunit [Promethearchaeota archaeon]|nr:MAG: carbamoyl-phosphate synthase small subunit [Candidatus Lokiarchaeota archaeon]